MYNLYKNSSDLIFLRVHQEYSSPNSLNNCMPFKNLSAAFLERNGSFEAPISSLKAWVAFLWGGQSSREINAAILNSEVPVEPWNRWVLPGWVELTCHCRFFAPLQELMEFVDKIEKHGIEAFNFETRAVYLYVLLCTYKYI